MLGVGVTVGVAVLGTKVGECLGVASWFGKQESVSVVSIRDSSILIFWWKIAQQ